MSDIDFFFNQSSISRYSPTSNFRYQYAAMKSTYYGLFVFSCPTWCYQSPASYFVSSQPTVWHHSAETHMLLSVTPCCCSMTSSSKGKLGKIIIIIVDCFSLIVKPGNLRNSFFWHDYLILENLKKKSYFYIFPEYLYLPLFIYNVFISR